MKSIALVSDSVSLPIDYDMPHLIEACKNLHLKVSVCNWDDQSLDWSNFDAIVLRSPWSYTKRTSEFISWCKTVSLTGKLINPLSAVIWGLNKYYLEDIQSHGVPIIPTKILNIGCDVAFELENFFTIHEGYNDFVIKPTVGAYSKDVKRFNRFDCESAKAHIISIHRGDVAAILQPYIYAVDTTGETNLTFINGKYSHAIHKNAMLIDDGTVRVPTSEYRHRRSAADDEKELASSTLIAIEKILGLDFHLFQARIDMIRGGDGFPMILEIDISEPSLNIPMADHSANMFAEELIIYMRDIFKCM